MKNESERERTNPSRQRDYWNALAADYAAITRISADDFHYGPQIPGENALHLLPDFPQGASALELGCGGAENSVWLAKKGLVCTALDISEKQLERARALAAANGVAIDLRPAALERFEDALGGGEQFDFVHSSHALEFVDDPGPVIGAMARRTKRGGVVMASSVHPVFNGEWTTGAWEDDGGGGDGAEESQGVFLESYFNPPDDIRDEELYVPSQNGYEAQIRKHMAHLTKKKKKY